MSSPYRLLLRALISRARLGHEQECTLRGHWGDVNSVAYSPDGKHIVSASGDKTVKIWDSTTGEEVSVLVSSSECRLGRARTALLLRALLLTSVFDP